MTHGDDAGDAANGEAPPPSARPEEPGDLRRGDPGPGPQHDHGATTLVPKRAESKQTAVAPHRIIRGQLGHIDQADQAGGASDSAGDDVIGVPEAAAWVRSHRVVLVALALITAQLIWKAYFLSHFFYWQDDYRFLGRALDNGFTWKYLTWVNAGHLIPGPFALAWVIARLGLYDWALATAVTLAILAASCLALLRLLRNLFGDKPMILVPLAIYLLCPLTLAELGWWAGAIESVPLQLATLMALDTHVRYVRTGRLRHAVAAAAWLLAGTLFFEKALVLPLLLFAVTSAFFVDGRWPGAMVRCLAAYRRAWLMYAGVVVLYAAMLAVAFSGSTELPGSPGNYRNVLSFVTNLVRDTFVPGALGGPWQWLPNGAVAYSAPPSGLLWLSWAAGAAIVAASIVWRKHAWRAWAILAGWLVLADMVPVIIGRIGGLSGAALGLETRYVADAAPVLAVCVGLAFWPLAGRPDRLRVRADPRLASSQFMRTAGTAVCGAFIFGSLWSTQAYQTATTVAPARAYITNARAALIAAPRGTIVVDQQVPSSVALAIFGPYSYTSKVIGAMARGEPSSRLRWVRHPAGTFDKLLAFGTDGRLYGVGMLGTASLRPSTRNGCWPGRGNTITVQFPPMTTHGTWTLHFAYYSWSFRPQQVTVGFGGHLQRLTLLPGLHGAYVPIEGSGSSVLVSGLSQKQLCVGGSEAGGLVALNSGTAIPAVPAAG